MQFETQLDPPQTFRYPLRSPRSRYRFLPSSRNSREKPLF
ncbi:hypothetical protein CKA32_002432 [Geitlerinema sp. FC II]|nr:hypothetical protein CKA32_002432 [Geitlerinema sp. FC II]